MAKIKTMYLGIVHTQQTSAPTIAQLINNPIYEMDIKAAIATVKNSNNQQQLKKALQAVQRKYRRTTTKEYTYLTDQVNYRDNKIAAIIIDVDNKKVVKNRFPDADTDEMVHLYLEKYKSQIEEFIHRFR